MIADNVLFRTLPTVEPPIPAGGGRIITPAGELTQILNNQELRFLAYLEFKPDRTAPRGNHYHAAKVETLYVVTGHLRAVYLDINTGESLTQHLSAGDLVTIKPGNAHVYYAEEYSQALEVSDLNYDPADTIPYIVEK